MKRFILALFALAFLTVSAEAANRFLTCNTTCTITAADTSIWGTTSGGTGASVPGSSDAVILDAATCVGGTTCTATMGSGYNPSWQTLTMGACTASTSGCILDFSANNNNITLQVFSGTGTGVRTLNMGNGTWTIAGGTAANVWDLTTVTNLTFAANSSTITYGTSSNQNRNFIGGGKTYNNVNFSETIAARGTIVSGNPTITTMTITAPMNLSIANASTLTVTNAPTFTGTAANPILFGSTSGTSTFSVASGSVTCTWCVIQNVTFSGGATFTASNSLSMGGNSGITVSTPSSGGGIIGG